LIWTGCWWIPPSTTTWHGKGWPTGWALISPPNTTSGLRG